MAKRVRTPTVIQMEAVECGAASLAMVLAYFGRFVPLEQLRSECGVTRDGSRAINMVKVARSYGLKCDGFKKEPSQLMSLSLPLIVFWNFNHFVVVEGFAKDRVYLNDPASGPRTVTWDEFDKAFTGVVLTFEKTPEFKKGGRPYSVLRALAARLVGSVHTLTFIIFASFALVVPGVIIPAFIRIFVDDILGKQMYHWILWLLFSMLVASLMQGFVTWLQRYFLLRFQTRLSVTSSASFLWHVLWLPMEFYAQRYAGEVGSRVGLNDKVAGLLSGRLATAAMDMLMIVFYAAVMLFYDATLTAIAVALALIDFAALSFVARVRTDANQRLLQENGKLTGTTMGGLRIIETLKATGRESDFFTRWAGYQAKVVKVTQQLGSWSQAVSVLPGVVTGIGAVAVLCIGGLKVMQGDMTVGMLMAFQSLMGSFLGPISSLVELGGDVQEAVGDMKRLDDVLANPEQLHLGYGMPASATRLTGRLELKGVTFGYSKLEAPLIRDFDLTLEAGHRVALVGATGSGKSTVAKLVCGLYPPWSGEILFDGQPRHDIPHGILTASLAHVDQEIILFEGTIRDNLTLWQPTLTEPSLIRAARDACIFDAIMLRPSGLDSMMDEGGRNWSGGERQRLEIARALSRDPSLLVLDEATSALDPVVEKQVDDNLRSRGVTCLIIAHRLSTIRDCDEIIVLEHGAVVQRGTHDALVKEGGAYLKLIQAEPGGA